MIELSECGAKAERDFRTSYTGRNKPISQTMPHVLQFENFGGPASSTLLSDTFILGQEEAEYIVEEHGDAQGSAEKMVQSGDLFQLESQKDCPSTYRFQPGMIDDGSRIWLVQVLKPAGDELDLPRRLGEVLSDKEPAEGVSEVVEEWPLPDVE